jgi:hypothetical protein
MDAKLSQKNYLAQKLIKQQWKEENLTGNLS